MTLDSRLAKLKNYSSTNKIARLNKLIYDLAFTEESLKAYSQDDLTYIHVKLHNALSYKKPFAPLDNIKVVHDLVSVLLKNHVVVDALDRNI